MKGPRCKMRHEHSTVSDSRNARFSEIRTGAITCAESARGLPEHDASFNGQAKNPALLPGLARRRTASRPRCPR